MENQHRHINGYRDLSQEEIDLMNEIKSEGERLEALVNKVKANINPELQADTARNPNRWAAMAATDFQTGLMALVRAVAVPDSF